MQMSAFVLRHIQGISYYSCRAFDELPGLRHGFSTRLGEGSLNLGYTSWDSDERVSGNRQRFLSALQLHEANLVTLHQIHSNCVHIIKDMPGRWNQPEGDALVTQVEGIALAVQTADCLPVLIADPERKVVAAVHSGWRGTLGRLGATTIEEMQRVYGSDSAQLLVAVGPGIRACCYEVGPDVAEAFEQKYPQCCLSRPMPGRKEKYLLDLPKALEAQFETAGIRSQNRFDLGICTRCNRHEFFSYRAEGPLSGRMMAVIARMRPGAD